MDQHAVTTSPGQPVSPAVISSAPRFEPQSFVFFKQENSEELLKIGPDGFWVRGVKVEQGPGEADEVYRAFLDFMKLTPRA